VLKLLLERLLLLEEMLPEDPLLDDRLQLE
jgi:hypothetical protein